MFTVKIRGAELHMLPLKQMDETFKVEPPSSDGYVLASTANQAVFQTWCGHSKHWGYELVIVANPQVPPIEVEARQDHAPAKHLVLWRVATAALVLGVLAVVGYRAFIA